MDNSIVEIIDVLRGHNFYGAGECTEIAKGKYHIVSDWKGMVQKIRRIFKYI
tara:strand:- start:2991 stop:3146 length:156 start_codon:yes stop_codon:yes gene_type:complete